MLDVNVKKVDRNKLNIKCTRVVKLCKIGVFLLFCFCIFSIPQVFHFQKIPREEFSSFASSAAKSFFIVLHERTTFTINKT